MFINPDFPFLGSSPDGVVDDDSIVEIKCPYNGRNNVISPGKSFPFLEKDENEKFRLKRNHNYYYQILGQLAISKRIRCFFVVYTFVDCFVEEIVFDHDFFHEAMLPQLSRFYELNYRPFIASKL